MDATAALVNERQHLDFTMKEVAEGAGVSLRTVYNHFPDRADLLDALGRTYDEMMAARGGPSAADLGSGLDLADAVRASHRISEELGGLSEAFAQMQRPDIGRDRDRTDPGSRQLPDRCGPPPPRCRAGSSPSRPHARHQAHSLHRGLSLLSPGDDGQPAF